MFINASNECSTSLNASCLCNLKAGAAYFDESCIITFPIFNFDILVFNYFLNFIVLKGVYSHCRPVSCVEVVLLCAGYGHNLNSLPKQTMFNMFIRLAHIFNGPILACLKRKQVIASDFIVLYYLFGFFFYKASVIKLKRDNFGSLYKPFHLF